jgi:hypothetical protein
MPRALLNLQDPADLRAAQGQWRFAPGLVPGEPNEGFMSQLAGSPARLVDYDDSTVEQLFVQIERRLDRLCASKASRLADWYECQGARFRAVPPFEKGG